MLLLPDLADINCQNRSCKHLLGVYQPDDTERFEVWYCEAFPEGIPDDIAYGDNLHEVPTDDQLNEIVYERGEMT